MNKVGQEQCAAAQCRPHKNISECEKWDGKEEKVVAFRCVNYAKMPGTWRWVLLASICAPSVPALHRPPLSQSTNQQQVVKDQTRVFVCFIPPTWNYIYSVYFFSFISDAVNPAVKTRSGSQFSARKKKSMIDDWKCKVHFQSSIWNSDANNNYKSINHC